MSAISAGVGGSRREGALQWAVVFVPPAAWAAQFLVNYNLADSLGCSPGHVVGMGSVKGVLGAVTGLAALACIVSGLVALRAWRRWRANDATTGKRAEWMALAGVMVAALFLLLILAGFLPLALLSPPCAPSM